MIVQKAAALVPAKVRVVAKVRSRPAEHLGFVAYAGAEVAGAGHAIVVAVAVYLLITGLAVFFANDLAELFERAAID